MKYVKVRVAFLVCCLGAVSCNPRPQTAETLSPPLVTELRKLVESYGLLGRFSGAMAVVVGGEIFFAHSHGLANREDRVANSSETRFDLGSLTKQFTAAAILKLEADGALRVEDPIATHLPDYPHPQADRVTIHHLLSHRSGIPSLWRLGDGLEDIHSTTDPIDLDRLLAFFQSRDLLFEPGERFRYSNSGYVVLAAIIEKVSGKPYESYLEEALFRPLAMNDTGCEPVAGDAVAYHGHAPDIVPAPSEHWSWSVGDGCVRSTILDLAKWDMALGDDRLLPPEQREKLFATHSELRSKRGYGYGWFLSEMQGRPVIHHSGAGDGLVVEFYRFRDENVSFIVLANYAPEIGTNAPSAIITQAASRFFGLPSEGGPPAVVDLSPAELSRVAGRYSMASGGLIDMRVDDGKLWIEALGEPASIFDYGMLEDPNVFERAVEAARRSINAALEDDFARIAVCESLREDLAPGELRDEWRETLHGKGTLIEIVPARASRYPGDETLIVVTRLLFEEGEVFFSLDLTPALDVCGWYVMERAEFEARSSLARPTRVPLASLGPNEFLADGFNFREQDIHLIFEPADTGAVAGLLMKGAVEHRGHRIAAPAEAENEP